MDSHQRETIVRAGMMSGTGLVLASPAYAQIAQLSSGLSWIQATITGVGVVIMVIAIMWTGVKMMFSHAKWSEVAHIFFGGILVGGAAAIGPQLFAGGAGG
ncbi:TrbC/VirB2 family protein [Asticcacaulis sp. W401b]|uniref:TrbC/VirB2 family protein n=1 Tax=Asticcacaulis sp. W401b TaxID=3388666 RepID=UPI0039708815